MTVEYAKRALGDLDAIAEYYGSVGTASVAEQFDARLHVVVERLSRNPERARRVLQRPGVRVAFLVTFPYQVFYRVLGRDHIRVLHIRHTARRPLI